MAEVRAALWPRVSTDNRGQDSQLQQADLERVCQQWGWKITKVYEVAESAFGKRPREQFQEMVEDARRSRFRVLVAWSMDRLSREGEWSVTRAIPSFKAWKVQFYNYKSLSKGRAVKLGMEKARAQGRRIGRPRATERRGFSLDFEAISEGLGDGSLSRRQAARELKIGDATLKRLLDAQVKEAAAWMVARPLSTMGHQEGQRLVNILADMLRSALAWEAAHGRPSGLAQTGAENALTPAPRRIHSGHWSARKGLRAIPGGKAHGNGIEAGSQEADHLRRP